MIIATVKKLDGTHLDHGRFASEEAALAWFQPFIDKGVYGQKYVPARQEQVLLSPEVKDENGDVISPAHYETIDHPEILAEFKIEFVDESSIPKSQQEINLEAEQFLAHTDWKVLRHIGQQALGLATSLTAEEYQELEHQRQMAREAIIR